MSQNYRDFPLWEWSAAWRSILFAGIPWLFSKNVTRFLISLSIYLIVVPVGIWLEENYAFMSHDAAPVLIIIFYLALTGFINSDRIFETYLRPHSKGIRWAIVITVLTLILTYADFSTMSLDFFSDIGLPSPGITAYLWILFTIQILAMGATPDIDDESLKETAALPDHKKEQKLAEMEQQHKKRLLIPFAATFLVLLYMILDPAISAYSGTGYQFILAPFEIMFSLTTGQKILYLLTILLFGVYITHMITKREIDEYDDKIYVNYTSHSVFRIVRLLKNVYVLVLCVIFGLSFFPTLELTKNVASFVNSNPATEIYLKSVESAQTALDNDQFEEAEEEFGYAAAAAGATRNLDDLEAMLNELEAAKNKAGN